MRGDCPLHEYSVVALWNAFVARVCVDVSVSLPVASQQMS